MKRFLLIAALCLFGSLPAKALILTNGESVTVGGLLPNSFDNRMYASINVEVDGNVHSYNLLEFQATWQAYASVRSSTGGGALLQACDSNIPGPGACYGSVKREDYFYLNADDPVISVSTGFFSSLYSSDPLQHPSSLPFGARITVDLETSSPNLFFMAPVPEPSTWLMMLLGFAALGGLLKLKNAKRSVKIDCEVLATG